MGRPAKAEQQKCCERCADPMMRKRFGGRLEDMGAFSRRKYCSLSCANTKEGQLHWGTYHWRARKFLKSQCGACGSTEKRHAHHVDGNPRNNDSRNIQTLCVYCHNYCHATADRLGWTQPGRLPRLHGWTDLRDSAIASSPKLQKSSSEA